MPEEKKTVLIVDDDSLVLSALDLVFRRSGYRVLLAHDGIAALAQLEYDGADCVLLDVFMPHKDGIETLIEIRRRHASLPVIVMSGGDPCNRYDILEIAAKFGANGTLRKPAEPEDMLRAVEDAIITG